MIWTFVLNNSKTYYLVLNGKQRMVKRKNIYQISFGNIEVVNGYRKVWTHAKRASLNRNSQVLSEKEILEKEKNWIY